MPTHKKTTLSAAIFTLLFALLFSMTTAQSVFAQNTNGGNTGGGGTGGNNANNSIILLEPLPGGVTSISPSETANMGAFYKYVNQGIWRWAFAVGVGIAVLQCTFAGFEIVTSNGDQGKVGSAKERFMWATLGLLMLFLAATILSFINPQGFSS